MKTTPNDSNATALVPGTQIAYRGMHIISPTDGLVYFSPAHQSQGFTGPQMVAMLASHAELLAALGTLLAEQSFGETRACAQARAAIAKAKGVQS